MSLIERKRLSREQAVAARRQARAELADDVATRLWGFLGPLIKDLTDPVSGETTVAAYWPMGDEMDVCQALTALDGLGHVCALPVVVGRRDPLLFRLWRPGDVLVPGPLGTRTPGEDAPEVVPGLVLAPLLAFDRKGRRLGYGGGYYDRTLRRLRRDADVAVIGVGFAAQELPEVPAGPEDERLDWIVTEREIIRAG